MEENISSHTTTVAQPVSKQPQAQPILPSSNTTTNMQTNAQNTPSNQESKSTPPPEIVEGGFAVRRKIADDNR